MNVVLTIERLVLDGLDVSAADAESIELAVQTELARLLAEAPRPSPRSFDIARARSAPLALSRGADSAQIGRSIAQSVHGELSSGGGKR